MSIYLSVQPRNKNQFPNINTKSSYKLTRANLELAVISLFLKNKNTSKSNINRPSLTERLIKKSIDYFLAGEKTKMIQEIHNQTGFGKGEWHKRDVPKHTIKVVLNLIRLIPEYVLGEHFSEKIDGIEKEILFYLAGIFHDAGKKSKKESTGTTIGHAAYTLEHQIHHITKRFLLTKDQAQYVSNIIEYHDPPLELSENKHIRKRQQERGIYIEGLLFNLADLSACEGPIIQEERILKRKNFIENELKKLGFL